MFDYFTSTDIEDIKDFVNSWNGVIHIVSITCDSNGVYTVFYYE